MDPLRMLLWSVLFPAVTAFLFFFAATRWRARSMAKDEGAAAGDWWQGLAFIPGLLIPYAMGMDWPSWPPRDATQWLIYLSPLVGLSAWLLDQMSSPSRRFLVKALAVALMAFGMLQAPINYEWSLEQSLLIIIGLALGQAGLWSVAEHGFAKLPAWVGAAAAAAVTGLTAAAMAASGSLVLGELQGALALIMTAALVVILRWGGGRALPALLQAGFFLLTGAFFLQGTYYAELSPYAALAFALALPLSAWAVSHLARGTGPKRLVATLALSLLIFLACGGAVVAYKNMEAAAASESMYE